MIPSTYHYSLGHQKNVESVKEVPIVECKYSRIRAMVMNT